MQGTLAIGISLVLTHCIVSQALPGVHDSHPSTIPQEALAQLVELPLGPEKFSGTICPWCTHFSEVLEQVQNGPNLC